MSAHRQPDHGPGQPHDPYNPTMGDTASYDAADDPYAHQEPVTSTHPDVPQYSGVPQYSESSAFVGAADTPGYVADHPEPAEYPAAHPQYPELPQQPPQPERAWIFVGRLWCGGVVAALIAALAAAVSLLLVRGVLRVPVFAPDGDGTLTPASGGSLAAGAVAATLLATALMHALLVMTPQPGRFFGWIVWLTTAALVLLPLSSTGYPSWQSKVGTAVVHLVIGLVIGSLLPVVGRGAVTR